MRDMLFVFWGTLAGLTAIVTGVIIAWEVSLDLPMTYGAATLAGGLVQIGICLTAQFIVSEVGKK